MRARRWIAIILGIGTCAASGCDIRNPPPSGRNARLGEGTLVTEPAPATPAAEPGDCEAGGNAQAIGICDDVVAVVDGEGFGSLQRAIDTAQDGATVWLCPGSFRETARIAGRSLRLEAARPSDTTLDGNGRQRLLDVDASTLVLRGVQLHHGRAGAEGGAIRSTRSDLTVQCATIARSESLDGGAISSVGGALRIEDVVFRDNQARNGGAVHVVGTPGAAVARIERSTFDDNRAFEAGGALAIGGVGSADVVWVEDCRFDGNEAERGGAIAALSSVAPSLTVLNSRLDRNEADDSGGAILLDHAGAADVSVLDTVLTGGRAPTGAAIAVTPRVEGGTVALVGATVDDNNAEDDGAAVQVEGDAVVRFTDCDLGDGARDNDPADVMVNGVVFDGAEGVDLTLPDRSE